MEVKFYSMNKRRNSTARPSGLDSALTVQVTLKDSSGVLHPLLEIYQSAAWNPSSYNYAYIADFSRYYWVDEWTYLNGRWQVSMSVDPLATYKTDIGSEIKYVLRSASSANSNAVDTFYPTLGGQITAYQDSVAFGFARMFSAGAYVLGVANNESNGIGAITYYLMTDAQIRDLVSYMLTSAPAAWSDPFTGLTDTLYRAIYQPFDYIKSCKWFPITPASQPGTVYAKFGNYDSQVTASILPASTENGYWTHYLNLPSGWNSLEAKYRVAPNASVFLHFNPFGTFEIDPTELFGYTQIKLTLIPDFMGGEAVLTVEAYDGTYTRFLCQRATRFGIDINLSSASINTGGLLAGAIAVGGAAVSALTGGAAAPAVIAAAGGIASMAESSVPTMRGSIGQTTSGAEALDGVAHLYYRCKQFANENTPEFGKPLFSAVLLSNLSGYIKCADGEIHCNGMPEELEALENFLTGGFFYE